MILRQMVLQAEGLHRRMGMKILDKVRIGSVDYEIKHTNDIIIVDHKECYGDINYNKKIIRIGNNITSLQGEEETLLHEILHGIVYERNFTYDKNDDETITEELARGLHQVIRDNPGIFEAE